MVYTTKVLRQIALKYFVSSSYLNPSLYLTLGLITLTILTGINLSSINVSADDTVLSDVTVSIPLSCNMEATVNTPHTATINAGTYQADIGTTTFKVTCNDHSGYSIYAIGYTNNEFGNTKLLATVNDTLAPTYDIVTGTSTSGSTSNWAMKLTPVTGTYAPTIESNTNGSFSSYHIVPSTYTKVATFPSSTDTITGSSMQATYAAFIAIDQPAGSYDGKVRYTLVHPASETPLQPHDATARCISYWPNASGVVDNMGDQCSYNNNQANVMLWPTNYQRPGYGFAGWSDQFDYDLNSNTNTGHIYGPMESITTPSDMTTKGLSLYAVWVKSAGNLQNWSGCTTLASGAVTALTDQRDNNTYAVAKLADGKCWMIENLRLADKTSNNVSIELSSTNTNNPSLPLTNTWWTNTDNDSDTPTTSNFLSTPVSPSSSTPWCTTNSANCDDQSMLSTDNTTSAVANMTTQNNANIYSYGNYYNWYSATAGNGKYANDTGNTSVSGDLCPTGWRLPKGGNKTKIESDDNEFWNLTVVALNNDTKPANYDSNTTPYYNGAAEAGPVADLLRSFPNNFLYSGYVNGSSAIGRGSIGYYWSSTVYGSNSAYYLYLVSSDVRPGTSNRYKYNGVTVRCLAGS